jgi:hypothetical protein
MTPADRATVGAIVTRFSGSGSPRGAQLRHTFSTLLIEQRESLAYVRDQLGRHDDATFRNLPATEPPAASIFASSSDDFLTATADLTQ